MNLITKILCGFLSIILFLAEAAWAASTPTPHPILFVTQVPQPMDFTTIGALFGNHTGSIQSAPRGGALWIRYPDGALRNLTKAAGFGLEGAQHTSGIAVREPTIHWSGTKAVFSMVVGAPERRYQVKEFYWQLYEITNFLDPNSTPVITKLPNQPSNYNNVAPCYGTDDRIIFASDRPRDGQRHLHPQRDEYEEAPVVTGLWSLDSFTGDVFLMTHSPSGAFSPSVDSFGRVVFVRWDHLQRDQQADADGASGNSYGTFNFSSEAPDALILTNNRAEIFPEPRRTSGTVNGHTFNHFFPWQINEDGTEEETLNHLGRHELGGSYRSASFNNDPNIRELYYFGNKVNTNTLNNFIHLRESPVTPGLYFGIDAPEFGTHSAGQVIALESHIATNADFCKLHYYTHRDTSFADETPSPHHSGLYRNPLPLSDGRIAVVHTAETRPDRNAGSNASPKSRYDFRLKFLVQANGTWIAGEPLTPGINASATWWSPDELVAYDGPLWELDPVEVRPRPRPARIDAHLAGPELDVFSEEGVDVVSVRAFLRSQNLALIVSRDVTVRDAGDQNQPYNLRVPGGTQTIGTSGKIYDIAHFQLYQADLIRGLGLSGGQGMPRHGRRVLAQPMHDPAVSNPPNSGGPEASVRIAADGSVAAFVPARRALSWQTTAPDGSPVVRERYWVTFQPGEIRACPSCHGVNTRDQAGHGIPMNKPMALRDLLRHWKSQTRPDSVRIVAGGIKAGAFRLNLVGKAGVPNVIETTTDFSVWTPIGTNTPAGAGAFIFDDTAFGAHSQRFYRFRLK
ncbi:MAG: hypothetical protein L0Z50_35895 [Verrucomicrobiales bacterium]|nr:hypothetical protein [Verrucomicrobiales bacterium]